jgi:hypothetical protein
MKLGKGGNWETEIRIDQGRGGKDETWESRKSGNDAEVPGLKLTP